MTARSVAVAAVVGAVAGFAAARFTAPSPAPAPPDAASASVAAELQRLHARLDGIESALRETKARAEPRPAADAESPGAVRRDGATAPPADLYASWTDDEICLVAQNKGDDLALFKSALRRNLSAERRAKLLLALAAYEHRLEWHGQGEREALVAATQLQPVATVVGAEAMVALGYSYAAYPDDRWRCDGCFSAVLRDGPDDERRMKGAYGLAWRHDLGDEPASAAIDAYRAFLEKWGEAWNDTAEVRWARQRLALHEARR